MSIDNTTVRNIARLARIKVEEKDLEAWGKDLEKILKWIEQLNAVQTAGVTPMFSVNKESMPHRKDVITEGNCVKDILSNAPKTEFDMFVVPKVVE
jgi:aspartyl-tRNA(Asn)/glutamyl-tRNA(Gln) amidotransferase subunit C